MIAPATIRAMAIIRRPGGEERGVCTGWSIYSTQQEALVMLACGVRFAHWDGSIREARESGTSLNGDFPAAMQSCEVTCSPPGKVWCSRA